MLYEIWAFFLSFAAKDRPFGNPDKPYCTDAPAACGSYPFLVFPVAQSQVQDLVCCRIPLVTLHSLRNLNLSSVASNRDYSNGRLERVNGHDARK